MGGCFVCRVLKRTGFRCIYFFASPVYPLILLYEFNVSLYALSYFTGDNPARDWNLQSSAHLINLHSPFVSRRKVIELTPFSNLCYHDSGVHNAAVSGQIEVSRSLARETRTVALRTLRTTQRRPTTAARSTMQHPV